jgi:hypothetical protein
MCDDKVKIPFLKQEFSLKETIPPPNDIKIPYKDETIFEDIVLSNLPSLGIQYDGKISLDISGDICDFGNYLEANGILKFENIVSGPFQTEGGTVQFRRLYAHFRNLEIPVKVVYQYNPNYVCSIEDLSENIPDLIQSSDESGNLVDGSGNKDNSGNLVDGSQNNLPKKQLEFILNPTDQNSYRFEKYFVTNGLNETNQNIIFNNLESKLKMPNNIYEPIYKLFTDSIPSIQIGDFIVQEMNRILCLKYGKKNNKDENVINVYKIYNEKLERLKINQIYSVIFK